MAAPVIELLTDTALRHRIEDPSRAHSTATRWVRRVEELERLYRALLREDAASRPSR